MSVGEGAFTLIAALLKARSGIVLAREKAYLLDSRLLPVARKHGLTRVDDLAALLVGPGSEALAVEVVESMINNETFFFRDGVPFDLLRNSVLPALKRARASTRTIRIWCAAASTGQEPYSIAMALADDAAAWSGWTIEIVATDLSRKVLNKAEAGLYSQFEVQRGLPIHSLVRHFSQEGESWRIGEHIRRTVRFRQLNLCQSFVHLGGFDVIFCRNILMYLDQVAKADILTRLRRQLARDGRLLLGAAETVLGVSDEFQPDWANRGLYMPMEERELVSARG